MKELKGLDEWITREPQWQPTLITHENYADYFGDDLRINELKCAWAKGQFFTNVGWIDYEGSYGYSTYFVNFYMLDEDGEILVNAESYDENEANHDAIERKIDAERRKSKKEKELDRIKFLLDLFNTDEFQRDLVARLKKGKR